ncbi:MAG: hypothetical protein E7380_02485 [Clostridiales bacterium]|nr:hypothetical protein [Clostridiales bacterium]
MTNTEKFFVECVKKGIKDEKIDVIPDELDYKQFYNLCASHSMSVVVFKALEKVKDKLLPQFLTALQRSVHRHVMLDVQSEYDINTVLTTFEEHGLKYMPLKGYHLKKLYPSTDMRYASDCDVLIDVDQLKEVRALVDELGLATKRHDEHHDIVYYPETKTIFELHKTIFVGPLEEYFGVENKGFEMTHVREGYQYFYEMDRERFYISLLGHSAYHFAESAGVGIRHLTDIYLYRKAYDLNEEYLNAELDKCGLRQFKDEFEKVSAYFFEDTEPDEFTQKLAKHILESSLLANSEKKSASDVAANASETDDKKAKRKSVWKKIFLSKKQMKFSYPVLKKHIWLLPIFHVVRWLQVLFTRPKAIGQLKKMNDVEENDLAYMKEIRGGLGINHL